MGAIIGVIGASRADRRAARDAYEVGRLIARRGAVLICGGLTGVMEAAARGAREEGGLTIGVLPGDDPRHANLYIDIPIVTGMGYARNIVIVRSARAVIAIGGSYGTLSEIAYALNLGVPLIGLGTWDIAKIDASETRMVMVKTPEEAVEEAMKKIQNPKSQIPI
ncbi:MAG: TIGR00725 family protein [Candidatus Aureabacteria bacterium]|nr:TIGR00725 family protein [Candidatus Auribacterota bacterium]